jgi:DNA-binding winged helix-turn-helix (wHTH) protein
MRRAMKAHWTRTTLRAYQKLLGSATVVSYEEVAHSVYGTRSHTPSVRNRLWQIVHHLRRCLEGTGATIQCIRGQGYILVKGPSDGGTGVAKI